MERSREERSLESLFFFSFLFGSVVWSYIVLDISRREILLEIYYSIHFQIVMVVD
jgi:hypothetical protein